jgi:hypothetical protein
MDYMKSAAMSFIAPPKKKPMNVSRPEGYPTYQSQEEVLRPRRTSPNLLNPAKDENRDISKDKKGCYVSTMTYPLPPVNWEKKQLEKNRRMRNSKNNYL